MLILQNRNNDISLVLFLCTRTVNKTLILILYIYSSMFSCSCMLQKYLLQITKLICNYTVKVISPNSFSGLFYNQSKISYIYNMWFTYFIKLILAQYLFNRSVRNFHWILYSHPKRRFLNSGIRNKDESIH